MRNWNKYSLKVRCCCCGIQSYGNVGEKHGVGHILKNIWNADRRSRDGDFKKDQLIYHESINNYTVCYSGHHRNRKKKQQTEQCYAVRMGKEI